MPNVKTTAGDLRPNDLLRFPDGSGGYCWATVCRVMGTGGSVDVLLTTVGGADSEYRTFPTERPVVRRARDGEGEAA